MASRFFISLNCSASLGGIASAALAKAGSWNRLCIISSRDHMKMSPLATPFTWMPAGAISVIVFNVLSSRTAISAAIQPPSETPARLTLVSFSASMKSR